MKNHARWLQIILVVFTAVTCINVLILYWAPVYIPISSFSAVRAMTVAFLEKKYYLILVSIGICALLFMATRSVFRQMRLWPLLLLLYCLYDLFMVLSQLAANISDGYWKNYVISGATLLIAIVNLCIYCIKGFRLLRRE